MIAGMLCERVAQCTGQTRSLDTVAVRGTISLVVGASDRGVKTHGCDDDMILAKEETYRRLALGGAA